MRVAFGLESPPKFRLQSQLEASRSLRQTRRGQEIVSERGRFDDDSPYSYIKDLLDRRLKDLGVTVKSQIKEAIGQETSTKRKGVEKIDKKAEELAKHIKTQRAKIKLAQDIIDSLRC